MTAEYTYSGDRITAMSHEGSVYTFEYNTFGNVTNIKVAGSADSANKQSIVSYGYDSKQRNNKITYGNGTTISYSYNDNGNIAEISYSTGQKYTYTYNEDKALTAAYDYSSMIATLYEDGKASSMRLFTVADSQPVLGETIYSCSVNDDGEETVTTFDRTYTKKNSTQEYIASTDSVKTKSALSLNGWTVINSESVSDFYGRTTGKQFTLNLSEEEHHSFGTEYIYDDTETTATNRINRVKNTLNGAVDSDYAYTYDNRGNILTVSKSGTLFQQYVYDEASQLKTEYNYVEKTAMTYVYDSNGNIASKTPYTNVTSSDLSTATKGAVISYGYGDSSWSDKLTSYDGQTISYDESGNPTSYKGNAITWNGRLMTSYTKGERRYEFAYNSDGMRTVKRAYENGELVYTYTYIWDGDVLLGGRMEDDEGKKTTVRYLYDDSGELYGMDYNGTMYVGFIKNLQGDIVSIVPLDSENDSKVNIEYDAWGKPIIGQTSSAQEKLLLIMMVAVTNVAYCSYFYDFDTGLYYLRSRYYDPETGRFINADDTEQLKVPSNLMCGLSNEVLIINLFAYCGNNPIMRIDPNGQVSENIVFYLMYLNFLGKLINITDSFGEIGAYGAKTFAYNGVSMGHIKVKFEATYQGLKLYEFIDGCGNYSILIILQILSNIITQFKNKYGREFLFSKECILKEILDHFVGYMWSIGVSGYELPQYMKMYGIYCSLKGGDYKQSIYDACVDADIYEKDVYATERTTKAEAIAFDYFNGINSVYKSTKRDPYYYPSAKKRINKYNKNWDKNYFKLKGDDIW